MSTTDLQVFLISPSQTIIYSLDDPQTDIKYMFNAETLSLMKNNEVTGYKDIAGHVTPIFGVKPIVLGYANGKFELVYAPRGLGYVFKSDGKLARHNRVPVSLKSEPIRIPDIEKVNLTFNSANLPELNLSDPDSEDIKKYISMSQQGIEYNINTTYDDFRKTKVNLPSSVKVAPVPVSIPTSQPSQPVAQPVAQPAAVALPPLTQTSMPQQYDVGSNEKDLNTPVKVAKSPSPRISKPKPADVVTINKSSVTDQEIENLKAEIIELRGIVKALIQRTYQLYPVEAPAQLRCGNIVGAMIKLDEIQKKMANNEIDRMDIDPLLQPYAGSHRNNVRMLTFYSKDGKIHHVRANYDAKTNKMEEPK